MFKAPAQVDRFDEAVDWFLDRGAVTAEELTKVRSGAHVDGFWIGAGLQLHQIQSVFGKITEAIEKGETFAEWRKRVRTELKNDAHAETVFRNAVQRSYNAGRWAQMTDPDVLRLRPFLMFDAILDARSSEICPVCNGTILPATDEFWLTHVPPLHHRCRSSLRNLRREEAMRRGIAPKGPDTADLRSPGNWGEQPKAGRGWRPDPDQADKKLNKELERKADRGTAVRVRKPKQTKRKAAQAAPPPPATSPGMTPELAKRLLRSISGDGVELRQWIRDEFTAFGITVERPNRGVRINRDPNPPGTAWAHISPRDPQVGLVEMPPLTAAFVERDLGLAASGERRKGGQFLQVLIHEEIHMAGKPYAASYTGSWATIEEVSTELASHRVAERSLGKSFEMFSTRLSVTEYTPDAMKLSRRVAYQPEIEGTIRDVVEVTGLSPQDALDRIADAGIAMRDPNKASQSQTYMDAFMANLDVPEDRKPALLARLSKRKLP